MAKGFFDVVESREGYIDRYDHLLTSSKTILTAAQVKLLNTTPQVLITAPGPNKFISVEKAVAYLDFSTAVFTGGNDLEIRATDGAGTALTYDGFSAAFLNSALDVIAVESGISYWAEVSRALDQPVVAVVPVADPGGAADVASTLTIILIYRVIKVYN